jgi:hypothetical protein
MAVIYKPHGTSDILLIGGQSTSGGGATGGLVGPFPKFSINREELSTGDGTYLGTKFSIEITGTATLNPADDQDITDPGKRQSRIQGEAITSLQLGRYSFPSQGNGLLEISPYGGQQNTLSFSDARLLSVSLPEQEDQEAGVQNLQYNFSFEAYSESSNNTNTGSGGSAVEPTYKLSSAEESWELSENEGSGFFDSNNPGSTLNKTYSLTHTLSATGLRKYESGGQALVANGEAWKQAALWVKSRLKESDTVANATTEDLSGNSSFWISQFVPVNMDGDGETGIGPDLKDGSPSYKGFNHVRSITSDVGAGSYNVTETWLLSSDALTATHEVDVNIEDDKGAFVTVSINATFQGLDSGAASQVQIDKFSNAQTSYDVMKTYFYSLANSAYTTAGYTDGLRNEKITESIGQNRVAGTITYSVSYNDNQVSLSNAISDDITINYDNTEGLNEVIAKIPIIGKDDGPIIQDMNTTTIKIVSATLDAVMKRDNRTTRPVTEATNALEAYKPTNGKQQTKTESWNPKTGSYNLSMSWEYI